MEGKMSVEIISGFSHICCKCMGKLKYIVNYLLQIHGQPSKYDQSVGHIYIGVL